MKTQLTVKVRKGIDGCSVFLASYWRGRSDFIALSTEKTRQAALTQAVAALEEAIRQIQEGRVK